MRATSEERFFGKIVEDPSSQCWVWIGAVSSTGYGHFWENGSNKLSHRWAYRFFRGDDLGNLHLDHLCRNRRCVNPDHLEPVTNRVNSHRGQHGTLRVPETHCIHGHEFDQTNTYTDKRGRRHCRRCHAIRQRMRVRSV